VTVQSLNSSLPKGIVSVHHSSPARSQSPRPLQESSLLTFGLPEEEISFNFLTPSLSRSWEKASEAIAFSAQIPVMSLLDMSQGFGSILLLHRIIFRSLVFWRSRPKRPIPSGTFLREGEEMRNQYPFSVKMALSGHLTRIARIVHSLRTMRARRLPSLGEHSMGSMARMSSPVFN
jgi:hypothetical protein